MSRHMVPHSRGCHSGDRQVMALSRSPFMAFHSRRLFCSPPAAAEGCEGLGRAGRSGHHVPTVWAASRARRGGCAFCTLLLTPPAAWGGKPLPLSQGCVSGLSFMLGNSKKKPSMRPSADLPRCPPPCMCPDFGAPLPAALLSPARQGSSPPRSCPFTSRKAVGVKELPRATT